MIETTIMAQVTGRGYRVTWPKKGTPVRQHTITVLAADEELMLPVSAEVAGSVGKGSKVRIIITVEP